MEKYVEKRIGVGFILSPVEQSLLSGEVKKTVVREAELLRIRMILDKVWDIIKNEGAIKAINSLNLNIFVSRSEGTSQISGHLSYNEEEEESLPGAAVVEKSE